MTTTLKAEDITVDRIAAKRITSQFVSATRLLGTFGITAASAAEGMRRLNRAWMSSRTMGVDSLLADMRWRWPARGSHRPRWHAHRMQFEIARREVGRITTTTPPPTLRDIVLAYEAPTRRRVEAWQGRLARSWREAFAEVGPCI